jgi:RsiW-degrading membrane proteinase PrsW (M82 family)
LNGTPVRHHNRHADPSQGRCDKAMSGNRILFLVVLAILVLLVVAMVILSTGSSEGSEGLAVLIRTLVGVGVLVLIIRLVSQALRRR